jgi:hypothetical protein
MDGRIRSKLNFANVVSMIALFVALGGGAYAAAKVNSAGVQNNTLKSTDLKNKKAVKGIDVVDNSLSGADVNESSLAGVDKCPSGAPSRAGDVCFSDSKAAATWDAAERDCQSKGLRLPSISEALLLLTSGSASATTWADEVLDPTLRARVNKAEPKIEAVAPTTPQTYYCVAQPTN